MDLRGRSRHIFGFLTAMFVGVGCSTAQEVRSIDLTDISPRISFVTPAPKPGDPSVHGGTMRTLDHCDAREKVVGELKSTLIALDRDEYRIGDEPRFEVRVENAGSQPIRIPISPNRSDVQPPDPSQKFSYYKMIVQLWVGGKRWIANTGGSITLYGDEDHAGSMITLQPGEWVRIIGKGRMTRPEDPGVGIADDPVSQSNAQASVYRDETLLTSTASATSSKIVCFHAVQGKSLPLRMVIE